VEYLAYWFYNYDSLDYDSDPGIQTAFAAKAKSKQNLIFLRGQIELC